jgi:hypothetical protein
VVMSWEAPSLAPPQAKRSSLGSCAKVTRTLDKMPGAAKVSEWKSGVVPTKKWYVFVRTQ